ncbi:beta family protein [Paraburkholderia graminis]|uniref:beta family protein n=1 Tax=Paraburkholderia graminis TaxID=60548 RepID=UPI0038BC6E4E
MSPLYVPILKAKKGEFSALRSLPATVASKILPVLDVPMPGEKSTDTFEEAITKTAYAMGKAWSGRPAFVDMSKWKPNARTGGRVHVLEYAVSAIVDQGVLPYAVVAYDRWDDMEYSQALRSIGATFGSKFCLRLNAEALEDMRDPDFFQERLEAIVDGLGIVPEDSVAIVDFGDVGHRSVPDLLDRADVAIEQLQDSGFGSIVIAGGSMPEFVNEAVRKPNEAGMVHRVEMLLWKAIFADRRSDSIVFGDYGIRNPNAMDGIISTHNNGKIRYTIDNQFFILRGQSKQLTRLGLQQKALSALLVNSPHFMGERFSWGDSTIVTCSDPNSKYMGGPTEWIGIDTNHHIHAVLAEIFEHQRRVTGRTVPGGR